MLSFADWLILALGLATGLAELLQSYHPVVESIIDTPHRLWEAWQVWVIGKVLGQ